MIGAEEPAYFLDVLIPVGIPLVCFCLGVVIGERIGLYAPIKWWMIYLVAFPTGLVVTGFLIGSASITIDNVAYYGYMHPWHKLLVFSGVVMFYGVIAPELFVAILNRVRQRTPPAAT